VISPGPVRVRLTPAVLGTEQIVQTSANNAENRAMSRGLHAWFSMSRPEAVAVSIGYG